LSNEYIVVRDPWEVAHVAALHIESAARRAVERNGQFSLVLAGGASPAPLYQLIAARGHIDWARVHVFWSDERCVPPDHDASNYHRASTTLFARGAPMPDYIHRIQTERGCVEAAEQYHQDLAAFFGALQPALMSLPAFDLVLLGMGDDGHTASLFPGGPELSSPLWAVTARAPEGVKPANRVTLTLAAIAAAAEVCFIVTGATKRDMVGHILTQEPFNVPAARVSARHKVRWLLDREAGASLNR
jgi:6-phosphogluconolactonase